MTLAGTGNYGLMSVLVVDDYPDAAESLAMLLRSYGYPTGIALSGLAALGILLLPDIIILELRLRDMDGWNLVRTIQARPGYVVPAFIAVTTCGQPVDFLKSAAIGISAHLVKPAAIEHLISALDSVGHSLPSRC
ncbi:response regulator [Zavarzinella formosa]|uniref:response regulator n=1 Tax=Zavarzinella formosa TaxID=360055 RepID=UPI0002DDCCC4|nr:response regulator [Zavarzinella formosa]